MGTMVLEIGNKGSRGQTGEKGFSRSESGTRVLSLALSVRCVVQRPCALQLSLTVVELQQPTQIDIAVLYRILNQVHIAILALCVFHAELVWVVLLKLFPNLRERARADLICDRRIQTPGC